MTPLPCPFCGAQLIPYRGANGEAVSWIHPEVRCYSAGRSIGAKLIEEYNQRAGLWMQVVDNLPVFNIKGEGERVTIDLVNETIKWMAAQ